MNSKDVTIIALESSEDEEQEDPLRISPLPPVSAPSTSASLQSQNPEQRIAWRTPLNGVTITAVNGPSTSTAKGNETERKRIKPITMTETSRRSPPPIIHIVEPAAVEVNVLPAASSVPAAQSPARPVISQLFKQFTDTCRNIDPSEDMTKALARATKRYIANDQRFTYSKHFIRFLESMVKEIERDRNNVYKQLSEVLDELKRGLIVNKANERGAKATSTSAANLPSTSGHSEPSASRRHERSSSRKNEPSTSSKSEPSTSRVNEPSTSRGIEPKSEMDEGPTNGKRDGRKRNHEESSGEESDPNEKRRVEHYNKLRKSLKECHAMIRELETKEVDWEDDDDSSYMQLQVYRKHCIKIHERMCKLTNDRANQVRHRPRVTCSTKFPAVNKAIERFINKTGKFPDFADIRSTFHTSNKDNNLNISSTRLDYLAEEEFRNIGEQMQQQRQRTDWNLLSHFLEGSEDPAANDTELSAKLAENRALGKKKIQDVISSYAKKQEVMKEQPVEVGDGDIKTSEDDEDDNSDSAAEDHAPGVADNLISALGLVASNVPEPEEPITSFLNETTGLIEMVEPIACVEAATLDSAELKDSEIAVATEMEVSTEEVEEEFYDDESPSLLENTQCSKMQDSANEGEKIPIVPKNNSEDLDSEADIEIKTSSETEPQSLLPECDSPSTTVEQSDDHPESRSSSPVINPAVTFADTEPTLDLESLISPTIIPKLGDEENVMFLSGSLDETAGETVVTSKDFTAATLSNHSTEGSEQELVCNTFDAVDCDVLEENTDPLTRTASPNRQSSTIIALPKINNSKQLKRNSVICEGSVLSKQPETNRQNQSNELIVETGKSVLSVNNGKVIPKTEIVPKNGTSRSSSHRPHKRARIDDDVITID